MTLDIDTSAIDDPIKRKRREEFERLSHAFWKLCRFIDQEYANYGEALTGARIAANRARGEVMDPDKRVGGDDERREAVEQVRFEIIGGPEGPCLAVMGKESGERVAGPKPWGGGQTLHAFEVDVHLLLKAVERHARKVGADA